jgi:hypothetical protein
MPAEGLRKAVFRAKNKSKSLFARDARRLESLDRMRPFDFLFFGNAGFLAL